MSGPITHPPGPSTADAGPKLPAGSDETRLHDLLMRLHQARSNYDPRLLAATEIAIVGWFEPLLRHLCPPNDDRTDRIGRTVIDAEVVLSSARSNVIQLVRNWPGGDERAFITAVIRTTPTSFEPTAAPAPMDLTSSVPLRDMMSTPAVTLRGWMKTADATTVLVDNGFTAAPVIDDRGDLVGIVTEADLLRDRLRQNDSTQATEHDTSSIGPVTVADVMTTPVHSIQVNATAGDAARLMLRRHLRSLPVCEGHQVVGVVTRRDLLRGAGTPAD
jgi:CBS domain-containing protein